MGDKKRGDTRRDRRAKPRFATFHGVYCAGWVIEERATVATLALLFDKLTFVASEQRLLSMLERSPYANDADIIFEDFADLYAEAHPQASPEELVNGALALLIYSWQVDDFQRQYAPLFGPVFDKTLYIHLDDPARHPRTRAITGGNLDIEMRSLQHLLAQGALPVHEPEGAQTVSYGADVLDPDDLAARLGARAIGLVLPRTEAVPADVILEARDRLSEQLPAFWSAMLKLTQTLRARIVEGVPEATMNREIDAVIKAEIKPALMDLYLKLEKERRNWFHRLIGPTLRGIQLALTQPPISPGAAASWGIAVGEDVAAQFLGPRTRSDPAVSFLLELEKTMRRVDVATGE